MGDRVNWGFVSEMGGPVINLYSHWSGHERREMLANALDYAKPRWNDPSFATRIVISQLIGDQWANETGWGLMVDTLGDNEYPYLVVYWEHKLVVEVPLDWHDTGKEGFEKVWTLAPQAKTYSFEEFIGKYATQRAYQ